MDSDDEMMVNMGGDMNVSGAVRKAILDGNMELLEELHNQGADLNERGPDGLRPLHVAALAGREDFVPLLLSYGADINASSAYNETALYFAAREGLVDVVRHLLHFGPDVNNEGNKTAIYAAVSPRTRFISPSMTLDDDDDNTPPSYGIAPHMYRPETWQHCEMNDKKKWIFESLLGYGFVYEIEKGCEPNFFHGAVKLGLKGIVEDLLKYGADANMELAGYTPLLVSIKTNQPDITDLLLFYGADFNAQDRFGITPIYDAARYGNVKVLKILLTHGATLSDYRAIVHAAIFANSPETVEELLNRCTVDINNCTFEGKTALKLSLVCGFPDVTALLLDKGADVNARFGDDQETPLHYASFDGDHKNCETMLKKGAKIGSKNKKGRTPLHEASSWETVKILVQYGADINARDRMGRSPLHSASEEGTLTVVDTLLKSNVDIDLTDEKGKTALHLAFKRFEIEVVRHLLNHGADVNICDKKNVIPCFYVLYENQDHVLDADVIKLLKFFLFHIVRLQTCNWYVSEAILQGARVAKNLVQMSEEDLTAERGRCEEEIKKLKAKKILNSNISFGECLTKNISSLAISLNNEHVVQGLESDDVSVEEFPAYAMMLKTKFRKAKERKPLIDQCYEIFGFLTRELAQFPSCCAEAIMHYLSNQDLLILIAAWNATSLCSTETESMTWKEEGSLSDSSQSTSEDEHSLSED